MNMNMQTEMRTCEIHGEYQSKKFDFSKHWMSCPKCSELKQREDEAKQAEIEAAREEQRIKVTLVRSGITPRFEGKTFDAYIPTCEKSIQTKAQILAYAEYLNSERPHYGQSLIFVGKPGTGKTHLASALVYFCVGIKRSVRMLTALNMIRQIRETWRKESELSEEQVIEDYATVGLLIIDEIGVQYGSDAEKILFFEVLNRRYENKKPSVLMSNLPLPELKVYLGDRIFDRLKEDEGKVFVFDWESHRNKKDAS